ncbi:MAG: hypothetical protein OXD34_12485 [bacterium]|nr:hypothetical protein [bacterium]
MAQTADESLGLALRHLKRVRGSWDPPDWADLSLYGFYCLEACVVAAALHVGWQRPTGHPRKEDAAQRLSTTHGLPDVAGLLVKLNEMRKYEAYGDVVPPDELVPEDTAQEIEEYVESIKALIGW